MPDFARRRRWIAMDGRAGRRESLNRRDELFEFNVLFGKAGDVRGVVQCTVHADNLTVPAQARVIVERTIEPLGMFDLAKAMVDTSS
ncbi:hypothetical protein H8A95_18685 [Bradyrhizobium sp. Pear76]|uniref:hypothetical protein n=1 Tax=Bradyrhizobium oropedii TaxID=1571201 RepID=UPI001E4EEC05|nr:hypothetical protein [Bradyrhizobium oropedii]MCC8964291.1 hypothetical protein [Bradyrhizobium oropedii]